MGSGSIRSSLPASVLALLATFDGSLARADLRIVDHGSPRSARRPVRPQTRYIVLHTTEGAERGSLEKLAREGEAHYLVGRNGTVHRIVDRDRIATHAGRSLWDGHDNLDEHAIGIEVVGYHDEAPSEAQVASLRELLRQLQSTYGVGDEDVLTHSMVAYGAPNRWHRRRHRGRKRCAMRLADPEIRSALGLGARPRRDPDVAAGRLGIADTDLFAYLFPKKEGRRAEKSRAQVLERGRAPDATVVSARRSPWDIAKEAYASAEVRYVFPSGQVLRGDEIQDWKRIPVGTRLEIGRAVEARPQGFEGFAVIGENGDDPKAIAGDERSAETTIYLFPDGLVRTGAQLARSRRFAHLLDRAPKGTRILVGYRHGGYVTSRRSPSVICGRRWDYPSTFYRFPDGRIRSGDQVQAESVPRHTLVFFRS